MNKFFKSVALSSALLFSAGFYAAGSAHAATSSYGVKIQINDQIVPFPDAQPFIDGNDKTQVPIRFVAEKLGYRVDWAFEGDQVKVSIKNSGKTIEMKTGESKATVNGAAVSFGSEALFYDSRTYVPLRFISETFGTRIQWDQDNYIAIADADGQYHAPAWYKPKNEVKIASVEHASPADSIVATGKEYIGVRYKSAGSSPAGFDCSGFVNYVFAQHGISLPRTSQELHATGERVTDLKPGDLVFFAHYKATSHVGIYLGDGKFISATNSYGIHIDSLYSAYWGPKYVGAQRVL